MEERNSGSALGNFSLVVRIRNFHKVAPIIDGKRGGYAFTWAEPQKLRLAYSEVGQMGAKYTPHDLMAIDAQIKINVVLQDGFVCAQWKRELPLIVTSIGGEPVSRVASSNASQNIDLDRRSTLSLAIAAERRDDPFATYSEVLHRLVSVGKVIKDYKDETISYWTAKGVVEKISLRSFKVAFSKQSPGKQATRRKKPDSG